MMKDFVDLKFLHAKGDALCDLVPFVELKKRENHP